MKCGSHLLTDIYTFDSNISISYVRFITVLAEANLMILTKNEILERINSQPPLVKDFIDLNKQLQPAGIDLTLRRVYRIENIGRLGFTNKERSIPQWVEIEFDKNDWLFLPSGYYIVQYNEVIHLPLDLLGIGKPRSSLLRMGATIFSAVWDPGYVGRGVGLLVVFNSSGIFLKKNCRILQLCFFKLSQKIHEGYSGEYYGEGIT